MSKLRVFAWTGLTSLGVFLCAESASAQYVTTTTVPPGVEPGDGGRSKKVQAPDNAFELTLGSGYTRGLGQIEEGEENDIQEQVGNGVSFDLGLGYRISPRWGLGLSGNYQMYEPGDAVEAVDEDIVTQGASARIDVTYHFAPYNRADPWLRGGGGYRVLFEENAPAGVNEARLHGPEFFNLALGVDLRLEKELAIAPLIGADVNMFVWDEDQELDNPRVNTFVYAGLQVRIDIGGHYKGSSGGVALR